MIRFLILFLAIVAIAAGAAWYADHPGLITIAWQGWLVEISLGLSVLALAVALAAALLLYRFLHWFFQGPDAFRRRALGRRRARGLEALSNGLIAVAAGDSLEAARFGEKANHLLDETALGLLLQAQTAQLAGDGENARASFEALRQRPDTEFLGLRGLIAYAARDGDSAQALDYARQAYALKPNVAWVARELMLQEAALGSWQKALQVLDRARRHKPAVPWPGRTNITFERAVLLLAQARQAAAAGDRSGALGLAEKAFNQALELSPAALLAARLALEGGQPRKASKLLLKAWAAGPDAELAALAYDLEAPAGKQDRNASRLAWLKQLTECRPEHPESRRLLARAEIDAGDYDAARAHLTALLEPEADRKSCRLMATINEQQGRDMEAARSWLARAALAPPPPAWHCAECGRLNADWSPHCTACGDFASLEWRQGEAPAARARALSEGETAAQAPEAEVMANAEAPPASESPAPAA